MNVLLTIFFTLIFCYLLYWVVRFGVRDALADADERRGKTGEGG